jgi:hypothetical protein
LLAADDFVAVGDSPHRDRVPSLHVAPLLKVGRDGVHHVVTQSDSRVLRVRPKLGHRY